MKAMFIEIGIVGILLTAMVGVVSAAPAQVDISPESQTIPYEPSYVTYDVTVYDIKDSSKARAIVAEIASGPADMQDDLEFQFTDSEGESSDWIPSGQSFPWGTPKIGNSELLKMDVRAKSGEAPENVEYGIKVIDVAVEGEYDLGYGTTFVTIIPEFATIAIPVAAVLGLLIFFNHRKQRKE